MKKIAPVLILTILLLTIKAKAQFGLTPGANDPSKADLRVLTENHSLVSTTITPMELSAEGYVVGFDEGTMDIDTLKDFISQFRQQKRRAAFNIQNAVDTHPDTPSIPKLEQARHPKKKTKKPKIKVNLQARSEVKP